jgi:hypothetical protein
VRVSVEMPWTPEQCIIVLCFPHPPPPFPHYVASGTVGSVREGGGETEAVPSSCSCLPRSQLFFPFDFFCASSMKIEKIPIV